MDVYYKTQVDQSTKKANLIVLRKYGVIRHLAE